MNTTQPKAKNATQGILSNVPLAEKNWFQTGGNARFFSAPTTAQEFADALEYTRENNLDVFVLGQGANILISDDGFDGLVICPQITSISRESIDDTTTRVTAGSGVTMHDLIEYCLDHNITGLEEFSGIPGTVGGSVYINLHYYDFLLAQFLESAQVIEHDTGAIIDVDTQWFNFGYNQSTLLAKKHYLLNATFNCTPASDVETAYARGRRVEIIRHRTKRYPSTFTCGSFFRNFLPDEVTLESNGKKMIYVAYYLDKIGVKGNLCVGDAVVSYQHANMLVNCGKATTQDIINLARTMQQKVLDEFGIIPQPECQLIGFKDYPLLTE